MVPFITAFHERLTAHPPVHPSPRTAQLRILSRLCTAALLSSYGKKVVVCESHTQPGGCAHGFDRKGYKFDSGPSLFSGVTGDASFRVAGEECVTQTQHVDGVMGDSRRFGPPYARQTVVHRPDAVLERPRESVTRRTENNSSKLCSELCALIAPRRVVHFGHNLTNNSTKVVSDHAPLGVGISVAHTCLVSSIWCQRSKSPLVA